MTKQEYEQMSDFDKGIARDIESILSHMEDPNDNEMFDELSITLSERFQTTEPGQIPHKDVFEFDDK